MDSLFIECVKEYPCIWDTSLPLYRLLGVKEAAWKEITEKTNMKSVAAAKNKWKNMRDTHRESVKKFNKNKRNETLKHVRKWKYFDQMNFLLPHMSTYIDVTPPHDPSLSQEDTSNTSSTDQDSTPLSNIKNTDDTESTLLMEDEPAPIQVPQPQITNVRRVNEVVASGDALKVFFDSMYQSTRRMPQHYQREIKRKLFNLVMEYEDALDNTNVSQSGVYRNNHAADQTNYSDKEASVEPTSSGLQRIVFEEDTNAEDEENQDVKPILEFSISDDEDFN
ncbi:uncharacterized protein LOC114357763 [Ostrinia furnacalis]|uniref:uncharacterized protein LOC114357763 n=1 Tax=Ostrinia furnacalis TaxID=93504 RepID=UPI00103C06DB|nr:uncharacterized protein LOC114357763 [Ostrinia furnacalis]